MTAALSRLARGLGVEPSEGRLFIWGAGTLFLVGWASISLANVSETFFLKRIGVDLLPVVFLVNSLLLVGTTYGMGRVAARVTPRRLVVSTFALLAAFVVVLWLLLLVNAPGIFVLLVIASKQLEVIALIVFWVVIGGLLHGRQAKRLYAPIIAGGTFGRVLGSFASATVGRLLGVPALLPVAAIVLAIACLLAATVRSVAPAHVTRMAAPRGLAAKPAQTRLVELWGESQLFRLLVLSAVSAGTLGPMLYFQFAYLANLATRGTNGEVQLLDLYGRLRGFINLGVLVMQLVGTSRLFRRIGVPLASTLSPLTYLVGFFGVSTRFDLPSGIGAVTGTNLQDHAIQEPAQKILITLLPERMRAAATSLIEGPAQRIGSAAGNVFVLLVLAVSSPAWVGFTALPIAAAWLVFALALWRIYPTLLLEVAAGPMPPGLMDSLPELVDSGTTRVLMASLVDPDQRRCRAGCALVSEGPRAQAISTLARAIRDAPMANRALLIDTLRDLLHRRPQPAQAFPAAADDLELALGDAAALPAIARARLIEGYAQLAPSLRSGGHGVEVVSAFLSDPAPGVHLAAVVSLDRAGLLDPASADVDAALAGALAGDDIAARHIALEAVRGALLATEDNGAGDPGQVARWNARVGLIVARLNDAVDRPRAAEALAEIAVRHGPRLAANANLLLAHARDRDPRVRAAVLRFVGTAHLAQHVAWVIERLSAEDEHEAAAAGEALRRLGTAATKAMLRTLRHGKRATREAALRVLRDVPVDRHALQILIDAEVRRVHRAILQRWGLRTGPVADVVVQRLGEHITEGLHTILLLIAARLHEDRLAALCRLFEREPDGRQRAVLLEALEALLPPAERTTLVPLLENDGSAAVARAAADALGHELPTFDEAVRSVLADDDALARTLLVATLDQGRMARIRSSHQPPHLPPDAPRAHGLATDGGISHHARRHGSRELVVNKVEIMLQLRALDLFAKVTTRDLSELAEVVREESYPVGGVVVREGDSGACMYVVVDGEVRVTREGEYVGRCRPGEFFGEMAVFDREKRFATVTATTRVRLLRLERDDLLDLIDEHPGLAIIMCQTLAGRVRQLIDRIEGRGDKNDADG